MTEWLPQLEDLARDLAAENALYEAWMLLPAIEYMGQDQNFEFLLLFEKGPEGRMCGFFPFVRGPLYGFLPYPTLRLWHHPHCSRCTPLVRKGYAEPCWSAVLDWVYGPEGGGPVLDMIWVIAENDVSDGLARCLDERQSLRIFSTFCEIPFLRRARDADEFLARGMSKSTLAKRRWELRKLEKMGKVTFSDIDETTDLDSLIDEFLALEAAGWKGKEGTAIANNETHARFFKIALKEAHERGRMSMLQLRLDGKLLAARIMINMGRGSFVPKIAYDESYHAVGPGSLLEIEEIRRMHDPADPIRKSMSWSDSATTGGNGPFHRCWGERVKLYRYWIGGTAQSKMVVGVVPALLYGQKLMADAKQKTLNFVRALHPCTLLLADQVAVCFL